MSPSAQERTPSAAAGILNARAPAVSGRGGTPGTHALRIEGGRDALLYVPKSYDPQRPAPLLIIMHGAGGRAADVVPLVAEGADGRGILVLSPQSRGRTWDVIMGGYGPDVADLDRALGLVFAQYGIAGDRIAVSGFSDGASYALSLGIANGGLFRDVLAFSPGFAAPTRQEGTPRIFISHGLHDGVLPIDACSRPLSRKLKQAGYDVDYREFDGGHVVPPEMVTGALARFLN